MGLGIIYWVVGISVTLIIGCLIQHIKFEYDSISELNVYRVAKKVSLSGMDKNRDNA